MDTTTSDPRSSFTVQVYLSHGLETVNPELLESRSGCHGGGAIEIRLETRSEGSWTVVDVAGEIDLFSAPQLKERIAQLIGEGTDRLLVNLEKVGFMDSTGLGVLLGALKRVKERDGSLAIVCPPGPVHRVLTLTGLHKVFSIYESLEDAAVS